MEDHNAEIQAGEEAEFWFEHNRRLLDDIAEITKTMKEDLKPIASRPDATTTGKGN